MNTRSKRIMRLMIVLFCFSMALTGCLGSPDTVGPNASDGHTNRAGSTEVALKPYEIDWYYTGNGPQADQPLIEAEMNKRTADINTTVKLHPYDWGTYEQKIHALLATGEKVDLLFSATWGSNIFQNVRKGYITNITDLLPRYAPDAARVLQGAFLDAGRIDGRNYGIPVYKELAWGAGVLLNKALVEKYGFDLSAVKQPEDLEPMFEVIRTKEPGVIPCEAIGGQSAILLDANRDATAPGICFDTLGGTDRFMICTDDPVLVKYWKLMRKWYLAGYVRKDAAMQKDVLPDQKAGRVFASWGGLKPGKDAEMTASTGIGWVQIPMTKQYIRGTAAFECMMAVAKTSRDPERVLMFYNKFYQDEKIVNLMDYGLEGKHYVKKGDRVIDYASADSAKGWNVGTPWMFGDQRLSYLFPYENPNKWEEYRKWNEEAIPCGNAGFIFNSEQVKNEEIAIINGTMEFQNGLDTGAIDPEVYVPRLTAKLKAAGIDRVLEEVNRQYASFKAAGK